jgi:hypothetical protein
VAASVAVVAARVTNTARAGTAIGLPVADNAPGLTVIV